MILKSSHVIWLTGLAAVVHADSQTGPAAADVSADDSCGEVLQAVQKFGRYVDGIRPSRFSSRVYHDGSVVVASSYVRSGEDARYESRNLRSPFTSNSVSQVDDVRNAIVGWAPGCEVELPIVPDANAAFRQINGSIDPVDPYYETFDWVWPDAFKMVAGTPLADVLEPEHVEVLGDCRADELSVRVASPAEGASGSYILDFERDRLLAAADPDTPFRWPLLRFRDPSESVHDYGDLRDTAFGELPFEHRVIEGENVTTFRTDELSFEASSEPVRPIEFLPGIMVFDEPDDLSGVAIWGEDGRPAGRMSYSEYRRVSSGTPEAPAGPAGREPGRGVWFWATNAALAAAIVGLLALRRRAA